MQYLIIAYDNENALDRRLEVREEHLAGANKYLDEGKFINVAALIEEDKMVGSTLIVDFENENEIDEWLANEPYVKNNVWNMDEFQMVPIRTLPRN